jgi:hypothetical protein
VETGAHLQEKTKTRLLNFVDDASKFKIIGNIIG